MVALLITLTCVICLAEGLWASLQAYPAAPLGIAIAGTLGGTTGNLIMSGALPLAGHFFKKLSVRSEPPLVRVAKERESAAVACCFWFLFSIVVCYAGYLGSPTKDAFAHSDGVANPSDAKIAFVRECIKSSKTTPPMSDWPLPYELEFCGCAAAKSVPRLSNQDNTQIDFRGFLSAEQNQRLIVEPVVACMTIMRSEHRDLTGFNRSVEGLTK